MFAKLKSLIFLGLFGCICFVGAAFLWKGEYIKNDIFIRATSVLQAEGHAWPELSVEGRDLVIGGIAPSQEALEEVMLIGDAVYGVSSAYNRTQIEQAQKPYDFSISKDEDAIELAGFVPSQDVKAATMSKANYFAGDLKTEDKLEIAKGAPAGFADNATFMLDLMSRVETGEITGAGEKFEFSASVESRDALNEVEALLSTKVPDGLQIDTKDLSLSEAAQQAEAQELERQLEAESERLEQERLAKEKAEQEKARLEAEEAEAKAKAEAERLAAEKAKAEEERLVAQKAAEKSAEKAAQKAAAEAAKAAAELEKQKLSRSWKMVRSEEGLLLTGYLDDGATIDQLKQIASAKFSGLPVKAEFEVNPDLPPQASASAKFGLDLLSSMAAGEVSFEDGALQVSGKTFNEKLRNKLLANFDRSLPSGIAGTLSVDVAPVEKLAADSCNEKINQRMKSARIYFSTGNAKLNEDSFGLLDELSAIIASCPDARIEIIGHTDSDGGEVFNQRLSEARAKKIAQYMVRFGIQGIRIATLGLGESEPIADNDSPEGKAKNRRIEFNVIGD